MVSVASSQPLYHELRASKMMKRKGSVGRSFSGQRREGKGSEDRKADQNFVPVHHSLDANGSVDGSSESSLELSEDLVLMGEGEGVDALEDGLNVSISGLDESGVVDVDKESNQELAVHAISDTSVARDELVKVLLLEGAFHGGSEETTEGRNDGREESGDHHVQLDGLDRQITDEGRQEREARRSSGQKLRDGLRREERSNGTSMSRGSQLRSGATEPVEVAEETS